jgi:hypothetical protein
VSAISINCPLAVYLVCVDQQKPRSLLRRPKPTRARGKKGTCIRMSELLICERAFHSCQLFIICTYLTHSLSSPYKAQKAAPNKRIYRRRGSRSVSSGEQLFLCTATTTIIKIIKTRAPLSLTRRARFIIFVPSRCKKCIICSDKKLISLLLPLFFN